MKKLFLLVGICVVALLLCADADGKGRHIHECYSFSDSSYDVYLTFARKRDIFFLYYAPTSCHGKYQNAGSNSTTDYAAFYL